MPTNISQITLFFLPLLNQIIFSKSNEIKISAQSMEGCMPLETLLSALALLSVGALSDDEK